MEQLETKGEHYRITANKINSGSTYTATIVIRHSVPNDKISLRKLLSLDLSGLAIILRAEDDKERGEGD